MNRPILTPQLGNIGCLRDATGLPTAGQYTLVSSFKFAADSVIRWVAISTEITFLSGPVNSGAIGVTIGNSVDSAGSCLDLSSAQFIYQHSTQQLLAGFGLSQRTLQLDMKDCFVGAGTIIGIYLAANLLTPPATSIGFAATVSIAHNAFTEWNR